MSELVNYVHVLGAITGLYLFAVASPGPNFLVLSQLSLSEQRRQGIYVALGITLGSTLWAILAMVGVASLLTKAGWLYTSIRLAGALYLIWMGSKLIWAATRASSSDLAFHSPPLSPGQAFRTGMMTSLTNPKSGAFWISVFASIFPANAPVWFFLVTALMVTSLSATWHLGIAQSGYRKLRRLIDATCGTLLVGLGATLAVGR